MVHSNGLEVEIKLDWAINGRNPVGPLSLGGPVLRSRSVGGMLGFLFPARHNKGHSMLHKWRHEVSLGRKRAEDVGNRVF